MSTYTIVEVAQRSGFSAWALRYTKASTRRPRDAHRRRLPHLVVMVFEGSRSWDTWERHPTGDEVVICLSGTLTVIQEVDGEHEPIGLGPCEAMIDPSGVWHTADVPEPVRFLTITPGQGTEHRPR